MDKGQHLRLVFVESNTNKVIALSTEMTLHLSAQTEDSTTKDTTDTNGDWNEYDVTQRSGDIQFGALIGIGTDAGGKSFEDMINQVSDTIVNWKVVMTSGANNRTAGATILSGSVIISQLTLNGPLGAADYTAQLSGYGAYTVGA